MTKIWILLILYLIDIDRFGIPEIWALLICFKDSTADGRTARQIKYICYNILSKMSLQELSLTYAFINIKIA